MNPECDSDPSLVDILEREVIGKILIRSCFTEEEWDRLSENQITRCEQQYLKYINSVSLRKEHTLKEFIRQTEPAPEISQPEGNISVEPTQLQDDIISPVHSVISWSNSDPDKITSSQNRSWSSKTNSSSDEIYGETPRRSRKLRRPRTPRKLTLEEQWDASDKEHELEKAAKRAAEAALSKKADNKKGPGKTRKRKYRKKRGISLKVTQSVPERTKSGTVTRSQTALKKSNTKTKIVERESSTSSSSLDVSAVKKPRASKSSKSYNTQKKVIQKEYLTVASSRLLRSRTVRSGPPQPTVKHSLSSPRPNKNSVSPNTEHKRFLPYVGLSTSTSQQNFNGPGPSPVSSSRSKHLLSPSTENQRSLPYYGPFSSTHKQKLEDQVGPRSLSSRSKYSSPCAENPRSLSYYGPATSTYQQNFGGLGPSSVSSRSKHLSPSAEHPRSLPYYGPSTNTYQQNVEGFGPSPLPSTQSKILFSSNEHRRSLPYHAPSTTTYRQNFKGPGPIPTSSTHSKILTSSAEHQRSLPYVGPSISPYRQHFVGPRPSTLSSPRGQISSSSTENHTSLPYYGPSTNTYQQNVEGFGPIPLSSTHSKILSSSAEQQRSLPYVGPSISTYRQHLEGPRPSTLSSPRGQISSSSTENYTSLPNYGPSTNTYQQNFGGLKPSSLSTWSKHSSPSAEHPRSLSYYGSSTGTDQQKFDISGPSPFSYLQSKLLHPTTEQQRSLPYYEPSTRTDQQKFDTPRPTSFNMHHEWCGCEKKTFKPSYRSIVPALLKKNKPNLPSSNQICGKEKVPVSKQGVATSETGQALNTTISDVPIRNYSSTPRIRQGQTEAASNQICMKERVPVSEQGVASSATGQALNTTISEHAPLKKKDSSTTKIRQEPTKTALNQMCVKKKVPVPEQGVASSETGQALNTTISEHAPIRNYSLTPRIRQGPTKAASNQICIKERVAVSEQGVASSETGRALNTTISEHVPIKQDLSTTKIRKEPTETGTALNQMCVKEKVPVPEQGVASSETGRALNTTISEHVPIKQDLSTTKIRKEPTETALNQMCVKEKVPVPEQGVASSETGQALNTTISEHVPIRNYSSTSRIRQAPTEAASNQICMKQRVPVSEQGVASSATGQALNTIISEHVPLKTKDSSTTKIRQESTKTALNQMCVKEKVPVPEQGVASSETGQALNTTISEHAPIRSYSLTPRIRQGPTKAASNQIGMKGRVPVSEQNVASSETGRALSTTISEHVPIKQDLSTTKIRQEPTKTALNQMCVKEKVPVPEQGVASSETGQALNSTISKHLPIKKTNLTTRIRQGPKKAACSKRLFQNVIKHGNTLTVKPPPALRLANIGRVNTQPAKRVQSSVTKEEPGQKAAISASPCTVVCQAQASTSGTQSKPETTNVLRPSQTSAKSSETPRKEIQVGNRRFNVLKHGVYDIVRQAIFSVNEMANRPIPNHSSADNVVSRTNDNTATPRRYSKDEMLAAQVLANDLPFHVLQIVHIEVEIPTPEAETSVATTSGRLESNASEGLESSTSEGIECIADGNNGLPGNLHVEATTSSLVATTAVATTSGGLESSASEGLGCSTSEGLECIADSDNDLPSNVHVAATTSSTTAVATNSGGLESFADSHNDMGN